MPEPAIVLIPDMSYWVGVGFWWVTGIVLGAWWYEAQTKWLGLLAAEGVVPEGTSRLPVTWWLRPHSAFRTLWAVTRVSYPRAYRSTDPTVEMWRVRRARRRALCVTWIFGGMVVAIALMLVVELAQESIAWALLFVPIAGILVFAARNAYRYGSFQPSG